MARWLDFLLGQPQPSNRDDDEAKRELEDKRRELNQRSADVRAALTKIQVAVLVRRGDERD